MRSIAQLILVALSVWAVAFTRSSLGPLQETMQSDLHLSDNQIALLQGFALALPIVVCAIPLGVLIDRYSRVRLFAVMVALCVLASVVMAFTNDFALLFAARSVIGLAVATLLVGSYSLVADLFEPTQRGRATTVVALGEVGGGPAAFALGGLLLAADSSLLATQAELVPSGWRSALLVMAIAPAVVLVLMTALREPLRKDVRVKNPRMRRIWPELWRFRGIVAPLLVARIMVWIADGAVLVWGAPMFARSFGLPPERIGALMGAALLFAGVLGPLCGGVLADACHKTGGPRRTLMALAVLALLSAPAGLFALLGQANLAGAALGVFLMLGYTIGTIALTFGTIVLPGELRGLYLAISLTVAALFSLGVAPLVVSTLSGALGGPEMVGHALALVCGMTSVCGAFVFAAARHHFDPVVVSSLPSAGGTK